MRPARWRRFYLAIVAIVAIMVDRPAAAPRQPHAGPLSAREQLRSNFGDKLLARIRPQTGRLHGSFLIANAKSGRFSSSNPNMQNIPRDEALLQNTDRGRRSRQ
jgi:hypothetical protein